MPGIQRINENNAADTNHLLQRQDTDASQYDVQGERWLVKAVNSCLEKPSERERKDSKYVFHASQMGNDCDRFLYLHYNGLLPQETISPQLRRIFDHGHATETRYLKYFEKMRIFMDREVSVRIEDPPIHGRVDFILVEKNPTPNLVILELKTINSYGFEHFIPNPNHIVQVQVYLNILAERYKINEGILWYECKNDQRVKAFRISKDQNVWEQIIARCKKIQMLNELPAMSSNGAHNKNCACLMFISNNGAGV